MQFARVGIGHHVPAGPPLHHRSLGAQVLAVALDIAAGQRVDRRRDDHRTFETQASVVGRQVDRERGERRSLRTGFGARPPHHRLDVTNGGHQPRHRAQLQLDRPQPEQQRAEVRVEPIDNRRGQRRRRRSVAALVEDDRAGHLARPCDLAIDAQPAADAGGHGRVEDRHLLGGIGHLVGGPRAGQHEAPPDVDVAVAIDADAPVEGRRRPRPGGDQEVVEVFAIAQPQLRRCGARRCAQHRRAMPHVAGVARVDQPRVLRVVGAPGPDPRQPHRPRRPPLPATVRARRPESGCRQRGFRGPFDDRDHITLAHPRGRDVLAHPPRRILLGGVAVVEQHRPALLEIVDGERHAVEDEDLATVAVDGDAGPQHQVGRRGAGHVQPAHDAPVVWPQVVAGRRGQAVVLFGPQVGRRQPLPLAIVDARDAHEFTVKPATRSTP